MKATTLTLIAILAASSAFAQPVSNAVAPNSGHIQQDEATQRRDQQEMAQFRGYRQGLTNALNSGNAALVQGHHAKLINAMQNEVNQGQAKLDANKENAELKTRQDRQRAILADLQAIQVQGNANAIADLQAKTALLDEFEKAMSLDLGEKQEEAVKSPAKN